MEYQYAKHGFKAANSDTLWHCNYNTASFSTMWNQSFFGAEEGYDAQLYANVNEVDHTESLKSDLKRHFPIRKIFDWWYDIALRVRRKWCKCRYIEQRN